MTAMVCDVCEDTERAWDMFGDFVLEEYDRQSMEKNHLPNLEAIVEAAFSDFYEEIAWTLTGIQPKESRTSHAIFVYRNLIENTVPNWEMDNGHPVRSVLETYVRRWLYLHRLFFTDKGGLHNEPTKGVW